MRITYTSIKTADEVTDEILTAAEEIHDGWFGQERVITWADFIDRLDGAPLDGGNTLDLGNDMGSEAISKIKRHIRQYRKS